MYEIPKELEPLVDILIGMAGTLEEIRELTYTTESKISKIEEKIHSLEKIVKENNQTSFGNRVSKWLKHTNK